jgi:hypothetical protein
LPATDEPIGFERHIKPLFREDDLVGRGSAQFAQAADSVEVD